MVFDGECYKRLGHVYLRSEPVAVSIVAFGDQEKRALCNDDLDRGSLWDSACSILRVSPLNATPKP